MIQFHMLHMQICDHVQTLAVETKIRAAAAAASAAAAAAAVAAETIYPDNNNLMLTR